MSHCCAAVHTAHLWSYLACGFSRIHYVYDKAQLLMFKSIRTVQTLSDRVRRHHRALDHVLKKSEWFTDPIADTFGFAQQR